MNENKFTILICISQVEVLSGPKESVKNDESKTKVANKAAKQKAEKDIDEPSPKKKKPQSEENILLQKLKRFWSLEPLFK